MESQSTPEQDPGPRGARERLLVAAARLFAERGHEHVSIREVAAAAGVRHGGVNYHFRTKRELYLEVLRRFSPLAHDKGPPVDLMRAPKSPEEARALFARVVEGIVRQVAIPLDPIAEGLFHREVGRAEGPDEEIFREVILPRHGAMTTLIGQMCPHLTDERELKVAALNVISQCLFLRLARPVVLRLLGGEDYDEPTISCIAARIVETCLHGLLPADRGGQTEGPRP